MAKKLAAHERTHAFALVLTGIKDLTEDVTDALYEAGCDDCLPTMRSGVVTLLFDREAPTMADAILSAIENVRKANIGAQIVRIDRQDLVTQSEIARKIDRTRQQVHQYIKGIRGPGNFPQPVSEVSEGQPAWRWTDVAEWLAAADIVSPNLVVEVKKVAAINAALQFVTAQENEPELVKRVIAYLQAAKAAIPTIRRRKAPPPTKIRKLLK